jgi:uncharacterized membrane protein (DUF106 family)
MQFLEWVTNVIVAIAEPFCGWVLFLPRDVRFFIVGIATSLILVLVRKWTTDQEWLRRADMDQKRLKVLMAEAKRAKNRESMARYKQTVARIKMRSMKYEGAPLLWSLLPIILLATWCFVRLGFVAPKGGETVALKALFPYAGVGNVCHVIPVDGLECDGGWVRVIEPDKPPEVSGWWQRANAWAGEKMGGAPAPAGAAVWKVKADSRKAPYAVKVVYGGTVREIPFLAGSRRYSPEYHVFEGNGVQSLELQYEPLKLFGVVPGIDCIAFPPWLVAYLIVAVPFTLVFRRVLSVY